MQDFPIPAELENKIMHICLPIGSSHLMGADSCGPETPFVAGNNFSICINACSEEGANKIFNALSAGGQVLMPLEKQFWGALLGTCVDKFGVGWMMHFYFETPKCCG